METAYAIHSTSPDGIRAVTYFDNREAAENMSAAWQRQSYICHIRAEVTDAEVSSSGGPTAESPRARSERLMAEELATKTDTDLVLLAGQYARELAETYDATDRAHTATDLRLVTQEMERRYY